MKGSIQILSLIIGLYSSVVVMGDEPQEPSIVFPDCTLTPGVYSFTLDKADDEVTKKFDQVELEIMSDGGTWELKLHDREKSCANKCAGKTVHPARFRACGSISGYEKCEILILSGKSVKSGADCKKVANLVDVEHLVVILGNHPDISSWDEIFIFMGGGEEERSSSEPRKHNGQSHGTSD